MDATTVAIDLAKDVFEIAVADDGSRINRRQRLRRSDFALLPDSLPPCLVVMEACASSHYWARRFRQSGHQVRLVPAQYVRPYRRRNKTDRADTEAILRASHDAQIRPVAIKSEYQQAILSLHRIRSQWVAARTARINLVRGLLKELGVVMRPGSARVVVTATQLIAEADWPLPLTETLGEVLSAIRDLETRIKQTEDRLKAITRDNPEVQRLLKMPGIGLLTATALAASAGHPSNFTSGRHMAAWLGL